MSVCLGVRAQPPRRSNRRLLPGSANLRPVVIAVVLLSLLAPAALFADTNLFSPAVSYLDEDASAASEAVSYQYCDAVAVSSVLSYQYFEWPGDSILKLESSPLVSYFYQGAGVPVLITLQGSVNDSHGGVAGATVTLSTDHGQVEQTTTDAQGNYDFAPVDGGVYVLAVSESTHASSARAITLAASTAWQDFQLASLPPVPGVVQTTRQAPTAFTQPPVGPMGSTLKIFNGTGFINVDANNKPSPSLMTIVLTHGWTQDPLCEENTGIRGWPTDMAATLRLNGVAPDQANILGWDWFQAAHPCPLPPEENTPSQGLALGQALQVALGANYLHPVHFLGHSLGTLVNAAAANYLHGDLTAQQGVSPTPWAWQQTHMTLFDQAELSRGISAQVLFDGWTVDLRNPLATLMYAADTLQGWKPSMPIHSVWADNYISYVGFYLPNTFNVALQKAAGVWGFNPGQAHSYPMVWYDLSIQTPTDAVAGFQQSREYDLKAGLSESAFPSGLLQVGDAFHQTPSSSDPLALEELPPEDVFQAIVPMVGNKADIVVQGAVGVVQFTGDVAAEVWDGVQATDQYVSQGFAYVGNLAAQGEQAVVSIYDSAVLRLTFQTGAPHANEGPHPLDSTPVPMAWVPVSIPPGLPVMAFDFTVQGDPSDDVIVCGIGTNNLFSLQAKFVPTNGVSASRLIDVSGWAGTTNDLFFGFMGGTSANCTLQVDNIRFYSLQPPSLNIQISNGTAVLTWPSSAAGYAVETTPSLSAPSWETITNAPALSAGSYVLTNSIGDQTRFFRLRSR